MRIIYDPRHCGHRPVTEVLYGKPLPHPEQPERVEAIRRALSGTRWEAGLVEPRDYPLAEACRVHEAGYVAHLEKRCAQMAASGPTEEWFPYVWPRDRALDTGTPLQGATLELAWRSACVAQTGADLLRAGESAAYALCRPPGHHAARGTLGGYCYFNNAALAADRLLREPLDDPATASGSPPDGGPAQRRPGGLDDTRAAHAGTTVAILDLDIHHGNGTQDIFYDSDRVLYCSVHGDPDWAYPPHTGYADETGAGAGAGFNYNQPLPEGSAWSAYSGALDRALERITRFDPRYLVLSQGFDTFEGDRWGGFLLRAEHFCLIGERLRALRRPLLIILEGGYEPASLAAGSLALLQGLAS
jgi:acetoin utilization deacetylase AcuC-like enzyme